MWIFSITLFLQITGLFASYNKGGKRPIKCGAQLGSRGASIGHSTGEETNTITHPWAVAFLIDDGDGDRIHCSGSIIDPTHIITAAHCFYPKDGGQTDITKLTVVLGANDPMDPDPKVQKRMKRYDVKGFQVHDKYNSDTRAAYYDIAIVEVTKKIRFKSNIWPVCIPEKVDDNQNHLKKQGVSIIGYGPMTGEDDHERTSVTRLDLFVKGKRFCNLKYTVNQLHAKYAILQQALPKLFNNPSVFCANKQGRDEGTCGGDSGGPVLQFETDVIPNKWVQVAAVHGSAANCDGSRFPSIFVRLDEPNILKWIYEQVFPDKVDSITEDDYDYDYGDEKLTAPAPPPTTRRPRPRPTQSRPRPTQRPQSTNTGSGGLSSGPVERDGCTYTCIGSGRCQSKANSGGAGSCFPEDFGGDCFGIPSQCQKCKEVVDCSGGGTSASSGCAGQGTCEYDCKDSCQVRFKSCKQGYSGNTLGSCFPESFGGKCSGTPTYCTDCKFKCDRRNGEKFKEEV